MKKILCAVIAMMMLPGCAWAEGTDTALWQHEAGWIDFSVAITQEGSDEIWNEAARIFGESVGVPMTGEALKAGIMMGHTLENDVEDLSVEGNRMTGRKADGTELFSHEYALVEMIEEEAIMGGEKVHVFKAAEEAGEYTYLLMTEPVKTESESASYITFNLVCTSQEDYRALFITEEEDATPVAVCAMIEKDTGVDGLAYAVQKMFANPVVITK